MARFLNIIPAYGRTYETPVRAIADWLGGKDFKISQGPYLSVADVPALRAEGYTGVTVLTVHGYYPVSFPVSMVPA